MVRPWSRTLVVRLVAIAPRIFGILEDPGVSQVGHFGEQQQVIAAKAVAVLPFVVVLVDAGERDDLRRLGNQSRASSWLARTDDDFAIMIDTDHLLATVPPPLVNAVRRRLILGELGHFVLHTTAQSVSA